MKLIKYKSVNEDMTCKYDKSIKYEVGKEFEIKDYDKSDKLCSKGLHCSSLLFANGYDWDKNQKLIQVEVDEKDIIAKSEDKIRVRKLFVKKILTDKEIDRQFEKEFYERFKIRGLWDYVKEFRKKEFLTKKVTNREKEKIKKLLIKTNKKLKKYGWNYSNKVRFINLDSLCESLWDSLWYSLGDSLGDSLRDSLCESLWDILWYSLWDSLRYSLCESLWDILWYSLWDSLRYSLGDSLACKISKKHNSKLLDDLIDVFRMGYLVAGKDKNNNWLVIVEK